MFIMPGLIFALYVTGSLNVVISPEHRREICRYIYNHQNEDGGWSTLILGSSTMFGTCSNYITLRLLGEEPYDNNGALAKGRAWILSHGGATLVPQWGKIWLSVLGVFDWSGNNPIFPELWLSPQFLPFHPGKFWCLTRMVYLPMAYLYGKKFVGPITPTILELREEIYDTPYGKIDWSDARNKCAKEDLVCPRTLLQNVFWTSLSRCVEPVLSSWPVNKLRERALGNLMEHIHYEDENTQYLCICSVNKALNMVCCWVEDPNSDAFKRHLARIPDFLWLSEDGMKAQNKDGTFSTYECKRTSSWIEILNPCESFPNMVVDYLYPECTSSVLQALVLFKELYPGYRTKEIETSVRNAAKFIESRQQEDGSWLGTWGVCFTYGAFFSIKGLVASGKTYKNSPSIWKACHFLLSKQLSTGGWGESHVSNETQIERDPTPLHRAAKELINMQLDIGEFPQQEHVGCFNCSLFFNYPNYRNLFPIWALGEYHRGISAQNRNESI